MAGDWIKMRVNLAGDPAVRRMASLLNIDAYGVVGRLHAFWAWAAEHTESGEIPWVTLADIDELISRKGFGAALVKAGWLTKTKSGVCLPHFDRHNGSSAKGRAMDAEKKRMSRSRPKSVPQATGQNQDNIGTREEKSREEKRKDKDACWARTCEAYDRRLGREATTGEISKLLGIVNEIESEPVVIDGQAQDPFEFATLCMGEIPPDCTTPHKYLSSVIDRCRRDHSLPGRAPLSTPAAPNVNAIAERLKSLSGTAQ